MKKNLLFIFFGVTLLGILIFILLGSQSTDTEIEDGLVGAVPLNTTATPPQFSGYTAPVLNNLPKPELQLDETLFEDYQIDILKNATLEVEFGGKYSVITWGCGTQCQSGAIINVETGEVFLLPVSILGLQYQADSSLLVVNPFLDDYVGESVPDSLQREFWMFDGSKFELIYADKEIIKMENILDQLGT